MTATVIDPDSAPPTCADEYYIAYRRFKIPGGDGTHRETCIDRMSFDDDGTIVPVVATLNGLQTAVTP